MIVTSWLCKLRCRFQRRSYWLRRGKNERSAVAIAAEVQQLETRMLLSGVLTDTTPVTTINAVAGTNTGNVVLATFTDAVPAGGLVTQLAVPGSTSTFVNSVAGSSVVGSYVDASSVQHGFLYNGLTGAYTTLIPAGLENTTAGDISGNLIVGTYKDPSNVQHGLLYNGSTYTVFDPAGSTMTTPTGVSGVNVAGSYSLSGTVFGFLYNSQTATYTKLAPPGSSYTLATGISGNIVIGEYVHASADHGFLYNGTTYTTIDPPGSTGTGLFGVSGNNVVGDFADAGDVQHGFLYNTQTLTFTTLDPTGSVKTYVSGVSGSNVVGIFTDASNVQHGFLYNSQTKSFTTLDPTGSDFTSVTGISGSNIVGFYEDSSFIVHSYLYQLAPVQTDFTPIVNWGGTLFGTPTVSVQLVSQSPTVSTWEVIGNPTYASAGNDTVTVTVTDATGSSVQTVNTEFNVAASATAPAPVFSFAGEYAVATSGSNTLTLASISQLGSQVTLKGSSSTTASIVVSPGQLLANGQVVATYENSGITFSSGLFAGQVWTKLDLPTNYTNQVGATVHIVQNGAALTFVDKFGGTASGSWTSPTQMFVPAWNETVTTGTGKLLWQDGSFWSENVVLNGTKNGTGRTTITAAPSQVSVFDYVNPSNKPVHLILTGTTNVIFVDGLGRLSIGAFINSTQLATPAFPGDIATISNSMKSISWTDGTVWTGTAPTTAITVTDYTNQNGVPVHLIQNGTNQLGFVDGLGRTSLGTMLTATTGQSNFYPGDIATFSGNTVTWLDGTVWTTTNVLPLMVTFTDTNGAVSHVQLTSATTLVGLDGALKGLTATRLNGKLSWSNGVVWDNLDFNGLNALFEMGTGYP